MKKRILIGVLIMIMTGTRQIGKAQNPSHIEDSNGIEKVFVQIKDKDIDLTRGSFVYSFNVTNGHMHDITLALDHIKCTIRDGSNITLNQDQPINGINYTGFIEYPCTLKGNKLTAEKLPDGEYTVCIEPLSGRRPDYSVKLYAKRKPGMTFSMTMLGAATSADNTSYLYWAVANEFEVERYDIEKKTNGKWEFIAAHEAFGTTTKGLNYNIPIRHDLGKNFYRIKQVDTKGMYSYSETFEVDWSGSSIVFDAFPNPSNQKELFISLNSIEKTKFDLKIEKNNGQLAYAKTVIKEKGTFLATIDLKNELLSGTYLITGKINDREYTKRIVIL